MAQNQNEAHGNRKHVPNKEARREKEHRANDKAIDKQVADRNKKKKD